MTLPSIQRTNRYLYVWAFLPLLCLTSLYNYLLFHSLAELFSVVIACGIFMISWNSRHFLRNNYLGFLGVAYLFVGFLDLLHLLAYKNMGVFTGYDADLPTQLWVAARYLQSLSLLIALLFIDRPFDFRGTLTGYLTIVTLLLAAIFSEIFPRCYIEGEGLTSFKKISEYIIMLLLMLSLILIRRRREAFSDQVARLLVCSLTLLIFTELAFTLYRDVYGIGNMTGHLLKIAAFFLIYRAMIETGLARPYELLFLELQQSKELLENRVEERTAELHHTINLLQQEIIERELAEAELVRSAEEVRDLYNNAQSGYHSLDRNGVFVQVNDTELHWLGYDREELVGKVEFSSLLTPESRLKFHLVEPRMDKGLRIHDLELEMVRKDGTILPVSLSAAVVDDEEGDFRFVRATVLDITERRQSERNIMRLNRLYRLLSATNQAIVYTEDRDGLFREFCRVAVEYGGFRLAWVGLLNHSAGVIDIHASAGATDYLAGFRVSILDEPDGTGPSGKAIREGTYYICNDFLNDSCTASWHDRARAHGLLAAASIPLKQYNEVIGVLTVYAGEKNFFDPQQVELLQQMSFDISFALERLDSLALRREAERALRDETAERLKTVEALREKEQLLLQQSRLAAMGEMINNIAHQWRQPLNALGLTVQQIRLRYQVGSFTEEYLNHYVDESMKLIQHMSNTIDDFRDFLRQDKEKVVFRVREVVDTVLSLVEGSMKSARISVVVNAGDDPAVLGFPNEYSQVLLNILMNARDALEERQVPEPSISIAISSVGGRAIVTVTDNAGGIPEEIIGKIFDPFFTTKSLQKGTGVGLFMSKTIVEKSMNGLLTACNTEQGAEFRIEV